MKKVFLFLIALFVANPESVFSQPRTVLESFEQISLTCPANPAQLASNIAKQELSNAIADRMDWPAVERSTDIGAHIARGHLVPVSAFGLGYRVREGGFSENVLLPHARTFVEWFAAKYAQEFPGKSLEFTTLLRTLEQHYALQKKNRNAASCVTRYRCTTHAFGMTVDLTYLYMSDADLSWTLETLSFLERSGDVIYFREMCRKNIHIAVVRAPSATLARHPQTQAEEDDMSWLTQPVTAKGGERR